MSENLQVEHALGDNQRAEHKHPDESEIIVNGRRRTVEGDVVSFEELVKIAFPSGPTKPNVRFTITYRHAAQIPPTGELDKGQTVKVRRGEDCKPHDETIFNVTETVQS